MNTYNYDKISIGMEETFEIVITNFMLDSFCAITGDINPLHCNREFAQANNFRDRVVYGMLTASLFSTLAGVYLPGKYSLIHTVELDFPRPVFVDDLLTVGGKVLEKNEIFRTILIKTRITRNGEKVCRGKMRIGVMR
jgi:3-hydroxybutyryl-CoA dehydratase